MSRQTIYLGLILVCSVLFLYSPPIKAKVIEQVIAVIDGDPYTLSNIREYAKVKMDREFPRGDLESIGKEDQEVLEQFITEKLLAAEVKLVGIRVSEEEVDRYIEQIKARNHITDEQLGEILRRDGVTMEKYRESIRAEIEKSEIMNRQVRKKVNITSEDVERYYKSNSKRYKTKERVRLRHILLPLPQEAPPEREKQVISEAMEIRERALAKEDFSALAKKYSEGAGASEGGDIGWISRGSLLREIEEVSFNKLSVGEVSQPLRTTLGVHLIKLEEREPERVLPLAEVEEKIKRDLYTKALEERFQKWLKTDLRRRHRVDVRLPGVVFRPEETKEGTVDSLMASSSRRNIEEERGFLDYLNPLSYIISETPIENPEDEFSDESTVSIFGVPLFTTESAGDVPEDPLAPLDGTEMPAEEPEESGGFFSSIWDTINPF